jgi:hypothetical protein
VAIVPHYDNAEGGTHDTRYCYLGEERLRVMEAQLPPEGWILGVDEHTVCIFDFDAGTASVLGLGVVTVRRHGTSVTIASGQSLTVDELVQLAASLETGSPALALGSAVVPDPTQSSPVPGPAGPASAPVVAGGAALAVPRAPEGPLLAEVRRLTTAFDTAIGERDAEAATEAVLDMEATLHSWSADTFQSDELDRARAALRRMVVRLGELAGPGLRDPRETLAPWVDLLLAERAAARHDSRFADGDRIRQSLEELGVEVRDTPTGTEWDLRRRADA